MEQIREYLISPNKDEIVYLLLFVEDGRIKLNDGRFVHITEKEGFLCSEKITKQNLGKIQTYRAWGNEISQEKYLELKSKWMEDFRYE